MTLTVAAHWMKLVALRHLLAIGILVARGLGIADTMYLPKYNGH